MRLLVRPILLGAIASALALTGTSTATSASAAPLDPGAYCRAAPSFPYSGGYTVNTSIETFTGTYYAENDMTCSSDSVCSESASYVRANYGCGVPYEYDDYTQVVESWVNPSNGQTYTISGESGHSTGSSYNPPGC